MKLWYMLLCKLGRPALYRDYQDGGDWWFALCKHCHRQAESEVHENRLLSEDW
jgi:hypothetical protein